MNTIGISMDRTEGALQRLLGLIERRGFIVEGVLMQAGTGPLAHISVDVSGRDESRNLDVLTRQIARLVDVQCVSTGQQDTAPGDAAEGQHTAEQASRFPKPLSRNQASVTAGAMP